MRKNFGAKAILYPMPVLIIGTYDENGKANAMNAAWGMISDTDKVTICLDKKHKTVKNIKARKAFTISIADADHVVQADYFGVTSGNKVANKFEKSGLTAGKSEIVDAPVINEFPLCLECEFIEYQDNEYEAQYARKVQKVKRVITVEEWEEIE